MKPADIQCVAAKALIVNEQNQILILKQSDHTITGNNLYHPPGGILDPGESIKDALYREVMEEIGVASEIIRLVDVGEWKAVRDGQTMHFVGMFYLCKLLSEDLVLQSSEASLATWVGKDNFDEFDIIEPSKRIIYETLQTL